MNCFSISLFLVFHRRATIFFCMAYPRRAPRRPDDGFFVKKAEPTPETILGRVKLCEGKVQDLEYILRDDKTPESALQLQSAGERCGQKAARQCAQPLLGLPPPTSACPFCATWA